MSWLRDNRHLVLAVVWVALAIPALLWWKESVLFIILLSLYANFETSLSAHEARKARDDGGDT